MAGIKRQARPTRKSECFQTWSGRYLSTTDSCVREKSLLISITSRAMSLLCLYAQGAKSSLKNRIIPRGKHESAMMISREKKTPLRSNSISNQGRLGWFSGRSKGKKRPSGNANSFVQSHGSVSETKANDTRIFSPLAVARLYMSLSVAIGIYSSV